MAETRICKTCGGEFHLSDQDINFFLGNSLNLPKKCSSCRNQARDAKRIKLTNELQGKFITRTRSSWNGDRSFLGRKIKLVKIDSDGLIYYQYPAGSIFDDKIFVMNSKENDGYWKIVDDK